MLAGLVREEEASKHEVAVCGLPSMVHALLPEAADAHHVVMTYALGELLRGNGHRAVDGHHQPAAEDVDYVLFRRANVCCLVRWVLDWYG